MKLNKFKLISSFYCSYIPLNKRWIELVGQITEFHLFRKVCEGEKCIPGKTFPYRFAAATIRIRHARRKAALLAVHLSAARSSRTETSVGGGGDCTQLCLSPLMCLFHRHHVTGPAANPPPRFRGKFPLGKFSSLQTAGTLHTHTAALALPDEFLQVADLTAHGEKNRDTWKGLVLLPLVSGGVFCGRKMTLR